MIRTDAHAAIERRPERAAMRTMNAQLKKAQREGLWLEERVRRSDWRR